MPTRLPDLPGIPQLQSTTLGMAPMSPRAAAPGAALATMGESLGELGNSLFKISEIFAQKKEQHQAVEDSKLILQRQLAYTDAFDAHQQTLLNDPDRAAKTRQWITDHPISLDNLSPRGATTLQSWHTNTASQRFIEVNADTQRRSFAALNQAASEALGRALQTGNRDTFEQSKDTLRANGLLPPAREKHLDAQFDRADEHRTIETETRQNPAQLIPLLQETTTDGTPLHFPHVDPQERARFLENARFHVEVHRAREFDATLARINANQAKNADIESLPGNLTEADRKALLFLNNRKPVAANGISTSWKQVESLHNLFLDLSLTPTDYARSFNAVRSALLFTTPPGMRQEIQQKLNHFSPENHEKGVWNLQKDSADELELAATYRMNYYLEAGAFDTFKETSSDTPDPHLANLAFLNRRSLVIASIRSKQLTTLPQVEKAVDDITLDLRTRAIASQISRSTPGKNKIRPLPSDLPADTPERLEDELNSMLPH